MSVLRVRFNNKYITWVCYSDLLHNKHVAVKEKCHEKLTKVSLLSYNNAPAQRSRAEQAAVLKCGFEEMYHPSYFYGPTPSD